MFICGEYEYEYEYHESMGKYSYAWDYLRFTNRHLL